MDFSDKPIRGNPDNTFPSRANALSLLARQQREEGDLLQVWREDGEASIRSFGMYEQVYGNVGGEIIGESGIILSSSKNETYRIPFKLTDEMVEVKAQVKKISLPNATFFDLCLYLYNLI